MTTMACNNEAFQRCQYFLFSMRHSVAEVYFNVTHPMLIYILILTHKLSVTCYSLQSTSPFTYTVALYEEWLLLLVL